MKYGMMTQIEKWFINFAQGQRVYSVGHRTRYLGMMER